MAYGDVHERDVRTLCGSYLILGQPIQLVHEVVEQGARIAQIGPGHATEYVPDSIDANYAMSWMATRSASIRTSSGENDVLFGGV